MKVLRSLTDSLVDKVALVRVDFNVPVQDGEIADRSRIHGTLKTINFLTDRGAKVVLITHFGRPEGKIVSELSTAFLIPELSQALQRTVHFSNDQIGAEPKKIIAQMRSKEVLLLENIRFQMGEEQNDMLFAERLALLGDLYVNDAFSCAHRKHASVVGVAQYLPSYAGCLFEKEVQSLTRVIGARGEKSLAIIGGKKVSTKLDIVNNLVIKMDGIAVVGAMANTFLKAAGFAIGRSFYEPELLEVARRLLEAHQEAITLPQDFICKSGDFGWKLKNLDSIEDNDVICDIGMYSAVAICNRIAASEIVLWNGPCGIFEEKNFSLGTECLAKFIASATASKKIVSVAGGGDTVAALNTFGLFDYFSYVSTAGGAFLEWLGGFELPGIVALNASKLTI